MLELKWLRENPEEARRRLRRKGVEINLEEVLRLDEDRRAVQTQADEAKAKRNQLSGEVGKLMGQAKTNPDAATQAEHLKAEVRQLGETISHLDERLKQLDCSLDLLLLTIPNYPDDSVPDGVSEDDNKVIRHWGAPRAFEGFAPQTHWEIGERLGLVDFSRGAKLAGSGFFALTGAGARLQRVVAGLMLDIATQNHGYNEVAVPYVVTRPVMTGTGQLPKFEDQLYRISDDDLFLIPTAEVPITNLHRDEILSGDQLPLRYAGHTPCFRREAGGAGADTRGMIRVHQFDKVELVWFTKPEESMEALNTLLGHAEAVVQTLELPYRVLEICSADLGFSNTKQYDLEVWAPGTGRYLEVSSCSNFTDYQARRANIRFRRDPKAKPEFVHTLNGSGLALPRVLVALVENGLQADGSVTLPPKVAERFGTDRLVP
jgi:seryl-tRNA synthetase